MIEKSKPHFESELIEFKKKYLSKRSKDHSPQKSTPSQSGKKQKKSLSPEKRLDAQIGRELIFGISAEKEVLD
jgi:hypothetical protein